MKCDEKKHVTKEKSKDNILYDDIGEALNQKETEGNRLVITILRSAVIYLRHNRSTPETYVIEIHTPGGNVAYEVQILKTQKYTLDEIFEKKLLFLLPFYLFCYENDFTEIEKDEERLCKMKEEYRRIKEKLDDLHEKKEITLYEKQTIISMIKRVAEKLAEDALLQVAKMKKFLAENGLSAVF